MIGYGILAPTGNFLICSGPILGWGWNCSWASGVEAYALAVVFPTVGDALEFMAGKSMFEDCVLFPVVRE